jgi:hypothetical protein
MVDIASSDLATFGGLPAGTPEQWQLSITLNSTVKTANGVSAFAKMTSTTGGLVLSNDGSNNGMQMTSTEITTASGSSIYLTGDLMAWVQLTPYLCDICAYGGTADASNTGAISLIPLTPGATFTTASGLTYPPFVESTPEPHCLWLSGATLTVLFGIRRITANEAK